MRILYIHQYFLTPRDTAGTRSYWISQELIKNGHQVTMLTTSTKIDTKVKRMNVDGIDVIYVKVPYSQSMSILNRLKSFVSFMLKSARIALKEKNIDLVLATSTPLTIGFPALVVKKLKKVPFLFEVRDLWPEVPIQMGGLNNKLAIKLALWFEKTIYKNAIHIVALSPGMKEGVIKVGTPENKVSMIPNMSKIDVFWSREKNEELTKKLGLKLDSFKTVYFGAMGIANGMDYIIEGIKHLKEHEDIEFVFMGGGATEAVLKEKCKTLGINNARFLGGFNLEQLSEIVNLCDVALVTFADLPILATNSPNKLFDSLSAGKPIIVNSPGWTKEMVEENECGVFVDPKKPEELANQILHLKANPKLTEKMGLNSRKLAETKYDKSILCSEFVDVIDSISNQISTKN
ncbi:glycosyltransferase family 4 protein [Flagellimonas meridianipacifica]|uniref:Glycosyltransferase involved in cell wall biosynthesis n=1 Tax=Flagellimonas meridianipacifica TaxID=1080225 RepID=A0A2T0MCS5_9FLAO|nr:glycosyltransferase family 4 protein [Allomuricauda pacifica]PRX55301.1 glycosyltransferase involved in cell wall biosynthesis [Allomuricauda pacifica]